VVAVEMEDERGLAGAVRAEQGDPLPRVDVQVDAEEGLVSVGVGEGDAVHLDHGDAHSGLLKVISITGTLTAAS
jgi:hypothetical protein